jgi:hypothetical protein
MHASFIYLPGGAAFAPYASDVHAAEVFIFILARLNFHKVTSQRRRASREMNK